MTSVALPAEGTLVDVVDVGGGVVRQVVDIGNLPATQPVSAASLPLPTGAATETTAAALLAAAQATQAAAETLAGRTINTGSVSGTVALDDPTLAALENISAAVSGTMAVSNFPATQAVSGTVAVSGSVPVTGTFWQTTQPISGSVSVSNFPATAGLTDAELRASPVQITSASAYAEDTPHVSGATGNLMLAIRADDDLPTANNGDYTILKMDEEGRLKVASKPASYSPTVGNVTSATSTVFVNTERFSNLMIHCKGTFAGVNATFEGSLDSTNGTDGTWFGVQAIRSNANTIETTTGVLGAAPAYAWELSVNAMRWFRVRATAWTSGTQVWTMIPGTYATEPIPAAQISGTQPVSGTVTATVTGGTVLPVTPTTTFTNSAATTNPVLIKNTAGTLWSIAASNTNAAARFLKLFNLTAAPTVGTSVPVLTVAIPSGGTVLVNGGANGMRFGTGISLSITGASGDLDTTAIGASDVKVATTFT